MGMLSKAGAWIAAAKFWLMVLALCSAGAFIKGCDHGRNMEQSAQAKAERAARDLADQSAGELAGEAAADITNISEAQEERNNAIRNAPGGDQRPSAGSDALNCERLRRAKADLSQFPACRSGAGGSGTTARP